MCRNGSQPFLRATCRNGSQPFLRAMCQKRLAAISAREAVTSMSRFSKKGVGPLFSLRQWRPHRHEGTMQKTLLGVIAVLGLSGCPKKQITIYRSLSEPGAMQTCDANQRFRAEVKGKDADDAKAKAEAQIREN